MGIWGNEFQTEELARANTLVEEKVGVFLISDSESGATARAE